MKIQVFGIKNCDSVKKVLRLLDSKSVDYDFFDFKKQSPDQSFIKKGMSSFPDTFINKRGTTYRKIKDQVESANSKELITLISENSSLIKRPVIFVDNKPYSIGVDNEKIEGLL